jgi:hypothetical protein
MGPSQASTSVYNPALGQTFGRPSTYNPEYAMQMVEFFASAPLVRPDPDMSDPSPGRREARAVCGTIPTFERFAFNLGVEPSQLNRWAERHEDFRTARARCRAIQNDFFVQGLAQGVMNPTGAIFVAKNILGWRDKIDIDQTTTQVDAGSNVMQACLASATPDELAQFRALLDGMKLRAIADGRLTVDGQAVAQAELPAA